MKKQTLIFISILLFGNLLIFAQDTIKTISGGVLNGKAVSLPAPEFPAAAKAVGACGSVNIKVAIDELGNVESAETVSGHPLLRQAAEKAARDAKFNPTILSGQAVKVSGVIVYVFKCPAKEGATNTENSQANGTLIIKGHTDTNSQYSIASKDSINGGVVNGKAISLPAPKYPAAATAVGASGAVSVQVLIDENGDVISANAVSGHPLLRMASESAARNAKFRPTLLEDQPVKVSGIITYVFNLAGKNDVNSTKERLRIMGLGASLSIIERKNSDYNYDDEQSFLKLLASSQEFPQYYGSFEPFSVLSNSTPEAERAKIFEQVNVNIKSKLRGSEAWQFEFGTKFGSLVSELKRNSSTDNEIKSALIEMKNMLSYAPIDIPYDVMVKLRQTVNLAEEKEELSSEETRKEILSGIMEILDLVSPQ